MVAKFLVKTAVRKAGAALNNALLEDVEPCGWHECRKPVERAKATHLTHEELRHLKPDGSNAPSGPTCVSPHGSYTYFCGIECHFAYGRYLMQAGKWLLFSFISCLGIPILAAILRATLFQDVHFSERTEALLHEVVMNTGPVLTGLSLLVFLFRLARR